MLFRSATGDVVLITFASCVSAFLRKMDTVSRWGGEEFAVLMPDTSAVQAQQAAERLRLHV